MNSFIESLNQWGSRFTDFAWPMFWQSSLLIATLLIADFLTRRKIRASVRYALWLVVLVKLCLPPTLALPTSPVWWLHKPPPSAVAKSHYTVSYDTGALLDISLSPPPAYVPPKPAMIAAAWLSLGSGTVSALLFGWLLARWGHITRQVHRAKDSERLTAILNKTLRLAGVKSTVPVKVTGHTMSPAVCGLFHPVILVPQSLADGFSDDQLRAVLLHELIHLRRRDVWLNCLQALVQIAYWWHPLVWLANARIRRVREEAVDDAVMLALRDEGDSYAPTLLEVAKLALNRPLAGLGLVGILESRSALRQRIERLVNFRAPRKAGLTLVSLLGIMAFTAVAVPMGEAPAPAEQLNSSETAAVAQQSLTLKVNPEVFIKNVKAQAAQSLRSPTNDYTVILLDLLRTEGVDCAPPNGIKFNTHTGEITMQNTPDNLEIFREVIEQLNRTDGPCELPLNNNPLRKRIVVIEARIYQMPSADLVGFVSGLQFYHGSSAGDDWWSASPEQFSQLVAKLEASSLQLIQRPRIQTASGITADFFIGSKTNSVEFDCKPFVSDGFVDLALRGKVFVVAPGSTAFTNYFSARASAENRGGIVVRVKNYGDNADNNLVAAIGVEIVTNTVSFRERLRVTVGSQNSTNAESAVASGNSTNLFSRTFKVNAYAFANAVRNISGLDTNNVTAIARSLLGKMGVNWETPKGKAVFYNDRRGLLFVRATLSDFDTVERIIPALIETTPQIHIKARFIEVPKGVLNGFGNFGNMIGGTNQPDHFTGIMTGDNVEVALKSLESRPGFEELAEPEVTTTSGRQTEMRATKSITVVTNFAFIHGLNSQSDSITPQTTKLEFGPVVDVFPNVLADGFTIDLRTAVSVTELLGYDRATNTIPVWNELGEQVYLPKISPSFAVRKTSANIKLRDGQTVVMGGMKARFYDGGKEVGAEPDYFKKTPATGARPNEQDKELLVFVTVTLVDPAGNRIHSDDEVPFAKNSVPAQNDP
jgi:beta-lactamase regulating signal transducer with metallopeptidase domain/type II secretory pathway component GspD/PulD (secretin)